MGGLDSFFFLFIPNNEQRKPQTDLKLNSVKSGRFFDVDEEYIELEGRGTQN